jgi:septal ring factor EnvC (AmiA/AmiB activator)
MRWTSQFFFKPAKIIVFVVALIFLSASPSLGRRHLYVIPSSASERLNSSTQEVAAKPEAKPAKHVDDPEQTRKTVSRLTTEVEQLKRHVAELERKLQAVPIRDRLMKEEEHAANLENELIGLGEKIAQLQSHTDELNEQIRSDSVQGAPVYGSTRPEEVREANRRRLKGELQRAQGQMDLLTHSQTRVQTSLSFSDQLILNLRSQLQTSMHP